MADVKPNQARFRLFYQDKTYEKVTESYGYIIITLFCEIGGSMGLFLGASVLTAVQLVELSFVTAGKISAAAKKRLMMRIVRRFQGGIIHKLTPLQR